jgi:predicted DNA-binding WGR domain protein
MRSNYGRVGTRGSNELNADDQTEKSEQCTSPESLQL